ncbi:Predicted oxidoreductase, contains short-chain dehydrogenase (SDR) and DUF2520 domains [Desulfofundulus australicus DSM 11792]|uniref:Predicted oxidoreductase, contains short-chain dehydrogenase (SDR) and DUF2520 domains n=1 Tax=Desulfofundulus australicus DSM 11792 TaxID=1121425 RepID=A0A1M4WL77_9FIRM|nr:DUF2520 domain-containing protein [Desulfofundulus australicus]SHE81722.1 Predicted oxidoreductase, contains short-chain dehydrogenase (SDR) and DUF2520 domains [Desulfofundulus australicus DSM 11792]
MNKPSVAVVGCGKVGSALALLLKERGYPVVAVASRSPESSRKLARSLGCSAYDRPWEATLKADLVFITTPDREITPVAELIAREGGFRPGQVVAHTSGAHASSELRGVREAGALAVSIHPLQSFADVAGAMENLPGSYFALEGDEAAIPLARQVVDDLKGHAFIIRAEDKPLYHAAACIASNYLVSLMHLATSLYGRFGLSREEAFEALYPLVRGTINNIRRVGPVNALTGPVSRGDVPTVSGHLPALERVGSLESHLYRLLGLYTVRVAREKGSIDRGQARQLEEVFNSAGNKE